MSKPKKTDDKAQKNTPQEAQPVHSPGTDPTNPVTQESVGDWTASQGASERRNNEPGLTEKERQNRRW